GDLLHHPVWPNLFSSLQLHPSWPARYGETTDGEYGDASQIAVAKQEIAKLPPDQRAKYFYSQLPGFPNPQAVGDFTRKRFLEIFMSDPRMVVETFFILKPAALWSEIRSYHSSHWIILTPFFVAICIASLAAAAWLIDDVRLLVQLALLGGV